MNQISVILKTVKKALSVVEKYFFTNKIVKCYEKFVNMKKNSRQKITNILIHVTLFKHFGLYRAMKEKRIANKFFFHSSIKVNATYI